MKKRTAAQTRLIIIAFALMLVLLLAILPLGLHHSGGVRVGVLQTARAYGAAMLLQTPSSQYDAVLRSDEDVLVAALNAGDLDAAVIGFEAAKTVENGVIRAVLGYENLWCVSAHALKDINDLQGRTVTLPEPLRGSRGEKMLKELLASAQVECEIAYGSQGDILFLDLDGLDQYLLSHPHMQVQFTLGQAWRGVKNNLSPAGLCLVVNADFAEKNADALLSFEKALHSSVLFTGEKTKKACAMAAAAGLAFSEAEASRVVGRVSFVYLTGADMSAAIHAMP